MMSSHGYDYRASKKAYFLEMRDGVRSSMQMQREEDDVLPGSREGVWRCQIVEWDNLLSECGEGA